MRLSIIAALSQNHVIGRDNRLPWHLPADLRRFKALTLGKPILMGRKTFLSLGKPLVNRHHIVLTRDPHYTAEGITVVHSIDEALTNAGEHPELMIIGGEQLFRQMLPQADYMYLTMVEHDFLGDTHFPSWDPKAWHTVSREHHPASEAHRWPFTFITLQRISRAVSPPMSHGS